MSLGIPYMGSKRKLSKKIIDYILIHNPNCKYFYDLFGGGGAISFEALQRKQIQKVYYNELNTGVVNLLKKIQKDGFTDDFLKWVSREDFKKHVNDDDWRAGLIKTCWSFGNNANKGYLFSEENEKIKHILHEIIVNDSDYHIDLFDKDYGIKIDTSKLEKQYSKEKRLKIMSFLKKEIKGRLDLQRLEQLQRLQQLERLEGLEGLEGLERLNISNLSYDKVKINTPIDETIIYLDPPYFNTAKYQKDVSQEDFLNYVKKSPYKIYMSSYELPFNEVDSFEHRSLLSANTKNKVYEKLFCNTYEKIEYQKTLF